VELDEGSPLVGDELGGLDGVERASDRTWRKMDGPSAERGSEGRCVGILLSASVSEMTVDGVKVREMSI